MHGVTTEAAVRGILAVVDMSEWLLGDGKVYFVREFITTPSQGHSSPFQARLNLIR
jgi:hypothetical protein